MKTYRWSVHDKEGSCMNSGEVVIKQQLEVVDIISRIEVEFNVNINAFAEFRLKQV